MTNSPIVFVPQFSNAIASVVGSILGTYYYHHRTIETLFEESGAPGPIPAGSCSDKCVSWLKVVANDETVDGLQILGQVLEEFMDADAYRNLGSYEILHRERARVVEVLRKAGMEYRLGGRVIALHATLPVKQLEDVLRGRDLGGVSREFERALGSVTLDPGAAVTAACAILEALFKVYIEDERLEKPSDQSIQPLWKVVQTHLGFDPKSIEDNDLRQVLSGLASVTHGLGAFRTHVGSAHGHGRSGYRLAVRHARLVVNAAHTLAMFVIDTWDERKSKSK